MDKVSIACIAYENNCIFIARRNPTGDMGGRWEFPGGKLEQGESDEQAVIREMKEEFGIDVSVGEKIAEGTFMHRGNTCLLHAYRIMLPHDGRTERFMLTEHTGYDWVEPDVIPSLDFVDSDLFIYPQVVSYINSLKNGK